MLNLTIDENNTIMDTNNTLCTRFIRKKFKCIMLFGITFIILLDIIKLVLEKFDAETLKFLFENYIYNNTTKQMTNSTL